MQLYAAGLNAVSEEAGDRASDANGITWAPMTHLRLGGRGTLEILRPEPNDDLFFGPCWKRVSGRPFRPLKPS